MTTYTLHAQNWKSGRIQLSSGVLFDLLNPDPADIRISDIAHALSNLCRFGGQVNQYYSVAQHCVIVSQIVPEHLALQALLHDATEAYLIDLPRPIKNLLPEYREFEAKLAAVIGARFNVDLVTLDPAVKRADEVALVTEARDLMDVYDLVGQWGRSDVEPLEAPTVPHSPAFAKRMFLERYDQILEADAARFVFFGRCGSHTGP